MNRAFTVDSPPVAGRCVNLPASGARDVFDPFSVMQRRQAEGRSLPVAVALAVCDLSGITKLYETVIGKDTHDGHELTDQERYERGMMALQELMATAVIVRSGVAYLDQQYPWLRKSLAGFVSGQSRLLTDSAPVSDVGRDAPIALRVVYGANWGVVQALATWKLVLPDARPADLVIHEVGRMVGDFGALEHAEASTNPDGDEDEGYGWSGPVHRFDPLMAWVRSHLDAVRHVSFRLGTDVPGSDRVLHGASSLTLKKRDGKWEILLELHTNAYAPVARPGQRDNSAVAAVLAPRLRAMMTRAVEAFGARWQLVDATGYTDLVDDGGFLLQPQAA